MKKILSNKLYILLFCTPAMLLFIGFVLYPLINIILLSFQETDGLSGSVFTGVKNFKKMFGDEAFWRANNASILLALLAVICDAVFGIAAAILISVLETKLQKVYRVAFLIPLVLSISVISQLWLAIYHAEWGLLNGFLDFMGLGNLKNEWLINSDTAMICVAIVGMWWIFGLMVLLAYTGIKSIPQQFFEAAKIDGANFIETTFKITLPLLSEVSKVCLVLAAVGGLYTFPQVYIMTNGGPGDLTQTVMIYMYKQVFSNQRFGLGSAVAIFAIFETFILLLAINRLVSREKIEF